LDAKLTGVSSDGQQWWIDCKKIENLLGAEGGISSDNDKSRIEGNMICNPVLFPGTNLF